MHFGIYPMVSLVDARAKRDEARAQLQDGRDPAVVKKLRIEANLEAARNTFERIAREWHENSKSQWAAIHADDVMRSLERDVFPSIGTLPISDLTAPRIFEVLKEIEERGQSRQLSEYAREFRRSSSMESLRALPIRTRPRSCAVLKPLRKGRQPAITDLSRLRVMIKDAEGDYARPVTRLALRLLALTAVRPSEIRGAQWEEFEDLDGTEPLWRIPTARMKGDLDRKEEIGGDHLVPLASQSVDVLRALWPLTGGGPLLFPSNRQAHPDERECDRLSAQSCRVSWPSCATRLSRRILDDHERVGRADGSKGDRKIIDLMLAHVPTEKVEGAYNRAAYMPRRRELAEAGANMLTETLPAPRALVLRSSKETGAHSRRRVPVEVSADFRFPARAAAG